MSSKIRFDIRTTKPEELGRNIQRNQSPQPGNRPSTVKVGGVTMRDITTTSCLSNEQAKLRGLKISRSAAVSSSLLLGGAR